MPTIVAIETPTLGDRSYLVHDDGVAFVVDPQRDIDRVLERVAAVGANITHVFETHIHNDYVSGGLALARATGAAYHLNRADEVAFDRVGVGDGDVIQVGPAMRLRVLATPGHTFTHLSYVLEAANGPVGGPVGVFTGGSLLFGATGRPDLLGPESTDALARHQYASAHRLAAELPRQAQVLPTHGFGSFCSVTPSEATSSTIAQELLSNPALTADEERFVAGLLAGLDAWPAYYARMGPANAAGPPAADLSPPEPADAATLRRRLEAGEWVVDLRDRTAFAAGHLPGSLNVGLDGSFATYVGWLLPWDTPVTLLAATPEQIAEAQRELVRIGIDRPAGAATGSPERWTTGRVGTFERTTFADLEAARRSRSVVVLDVRRRLEWDAAHVEGAIHVPLHDLPDRAGAVPGGEVWVHCESGYRASIAASLLAARGRQVVAIDDEFARAAAAGLALVSFEEPVAPGR